MAAVKTATAPPKNCRILLVVLHHATRRVASESTASRDLDAHKRVAGPVDKRGALPRTARAEGSG